jgi:hypothetical protein
LQYRQETYREYAILFGGGDKEPEHYKEQEDAGDSIGSKYGWYCLIHRMAGGDILKMDDVCKLAVNTCLNFLSYTRDVELTEELNRK